MTPELQTVTEGLRFPEGPVAMADGTVLVVEIRGQCLTRVHPDGRKEVVADLGGGPNGAAIGPDGRCYICNNGGFGWFDRDDGIALPHGTAPDYRTGSIQAVDLETGTVETLYESCGEQPLRGPNDIVFDAHGGFYFTDLGKQIDDYQHHGAIYYAKADGSHINRVHYPMVTPNGVGLSPDGTWLIASETRTCRVWKYRIVDPGRIEPFRTMVPGTLVVTLPDYTIFDSLAVQADGRICVATLIAGGITVVHPESGATEFVQFPDDPMITNICFGGQDMRDAWVTSSGRGRLFRLRWPEPGLRLKCNG